MLEDEFPLDPGIVYLNHAAVSPWPRRAAEAVRRFADENLRHGSWNYSAWLETEQALREVLRRLINARDTDEIALLKNTSEALSVVAHGLEWRPGDNVVITDQEFPSNRIVWESLQPQGVEVRAAHLSGGPGAPEDPILARMDDRTRLLSVSSVQYASGLRLDLVRLGQHCRARDILFCVDAIQGLGALRFDVQAAGADFVMADGHKWMLGAEGLALFYCRRELLDTLRLRQFGWHMVEHARDFDRSDWEPATGARRFECGSPNMLGIHALRASLSLLEEAGMEQVSRNIINNSGYIIDFIEDNKDRFQLVTPPEPDRHAGIVSFRPLREDPEHLHARLHAAGVFCALRGGALRLSPHFYTPREGLDRALQAMA